MITETNKGTREQLETLARWMGWEPLPTTSRELVPEGYAFFGVPVNEFLTVRWVEVWRDGHESMLWNPFTDANADYQVLERAREVWRANASPDYAMFVGQLHHSDAYTVGDYARAVLAVLGEQEDAAR